MKNGTKIMKKDISNGNRTQVVDWSDGKARFSFLYSEAVIPVSRLKTVEK